MWRLVRNATSTVGQEAGEEVSLGDVAKNATKTVAANLTEEMWRLVQGREEEQGAYNSSDHNGTGTVTNNVAGIEYTGK